MQTPSATPGATRLAGLLVGLLVVAGNASGASADSNPAVSPDPLEALWAAVGSPAKEASVKALLDRPEMELAAPALRAAGVFWHAGGPHAAEGLRFLAGHAEATVREAALRGIAVLGLRGETGSRGETAIRECLEDRDPTVRRAAYAAVGRIGAPADVPVLIRALESEDADVRSHALRALRVLTGEKFTPDATRWAYWWEHSSEPLAAQVGLALGALESGGDPLLAVHAWSILERRAWLARPLAEETAERWLRAWEPAQRGDGYRLAAVLRYAPLAKDIENAARQDKDGEVADAAEAARRMFGLVPAGS